MINLYFSVHKKVCYLSKYIPGSVKSTFNAILYYDPEQYTSFFASNSRQLPSCTSCSIGFHEHQNELNCTKAMLKDAIFIKLPRCASFFMKLHFVAALLGGQKFIRDVRNTPHEFLWKLIKNTMQSCGYWVIGVHVCIRICSCFSRLWLRRFYHIMDKIMGTEIKSANTKYEVYNEKNVYLLLLITGIIGRFNVLSEAKGRRGDMTLSLLWYMAVQLIRRQCGLETDDDDKYHWLLGSKGFVSLVLSLAVGINVWVYCKDAKYLKSMERTIIQKYLIE